MSKEMKSGKFTQLINKVLGRSPEWNLKADGHLDVSAEELERITEEYGAEFVAKFEKLLNEEKSDISNINQKQTEMPKETKLALLCALLGMSVITLSEDGKATFDEEQLVKIEAELKKLQDEKTAAETAVSTANSVKDAAEKDLSDAVKAMDDLDTSVKDAKTPAKKVEAIRARLAEKPAIGATGALDKDAKEEKEIAGKDEVNAFVKDYLR
jgi:membrane protease subunit (stomatin/prohibitin family)